MQNKNKVRGPSVKAKDYPILKLAFLFFDKKDNEYLPILSMNQSMLNEACEK